MREESRRTPGEYIVWCLFVVLIVFVLTLVACVPRGLAPSSVPGFRQDDHHGFDSSSATRRDGPHLDVGDVPSATSGRSVAFSRGGADGNWFEGKGYRLLVDRHGNVRDGRYGDNRSSQPHAKLGCDTGVLRDSNLANDRGGEKTPKTPGVQWLPYNRGNCMTTLASLGDWINGNFIGMFIGMGLMLAANTFGFRAPAFFKKNR